MRYTYLLMTALAVGLTGCDKDESSAALESDDQIARSQPLSESQEEVPNLSTADGETMQSEAHEALRPLDTDPIDMGSSSAAQDYADAKAGAELNVQSSELAQETEQTAMSIEDKANQIAQQAEEIAQQAETVADNAQQQASASTELDANTRIRTTTTTGDDALAAKATVEAETTGDSKTFTSEAYKKGSDKLALETPTQSDTGKGELDAAANTEQLAQTKTQSSTTASSKSGTMTTIPASTKMQFSDDMLAKGEKVYKGSCAACHASGAAGAPKLDDTTWSTRMAQGMDTLYDHAINGYQGSKGYMPAKGGFANLSDDEVKAAVAYMVNNAK